MICKRALRTGDGTYKLKRSVAQLQQSGGGENCDFRVDHQNMIWGWNDKDMPEVAKKFADIRNMGD